LFLASASGLRAETAPARAASKPPAQALSFGATANAPTAANAATTPSQSSGLPSAQTTPSSAAAKPAVQDGKGGQPAKPASPPAKARVPESQRDFCNLLWGCTIPVPQGYCPEQTLVEPAKFKFDSTRCQEARTLNARGVTPAQPLVGYNLYRFLGMEYRVVYDIEDELPISESRLAFLLADLPLSARLVSHFMNQPYTAEYIDPQRTHFKGTKGKRLRGDATLISGSTDEKRLFYFGYGVATVAWWTLKGPALMEFTYAHSPGNEKLLKYKMRLLVFPGNGVINGIMNLGLFRKVVLGKVKEVLDDITGTAHKVAAGGANEILSSKDWSAEDKKKVEAFLKLP
jgi:hypothetical protein